MQPDNNLEPMEDLKKQITTDVYDFDLSLTRSRIHLIYFEP